MAVEQAIDKVQIAWPAAPGTDSERAGEMRVGAGRESRDVFMPDMHPLDLVLAADRVGEPFRLSPTMPKMRLTPAAARVSAN